MKRSHTHTYCPPHALVKQAVVVVADLLVAIGMQLGLLGCSTLI